MSRGSYPLEAARALREGELEEAQAELGRALSAENDAGKALADAERALEAHRAESARVREQSLLGGQAQSADALVRTQDFLRFRASEAEAMAEGVAEACRELARARRAVLDTRGRVAEARAAREAMERHHERFRAEQRRRGEAREEAEVEDGVASRRGR